MKFFAKGKRGFVYTEFYKGKKIAIKKKNPDSEAFGRVQNEARMLKLLNKHKIGPKFIEAGDDFVKYYFVEGKMILDFVEVSGKKEIIKTLKSVFEQCYTLDKLKINKEEMHHPVKHIIVTKRGPVMIDFERGHFVQKPKNVTQFCQFVRSMAKTLMGKGIIIEPESIMKLAAQYSREMSRKNLMAILKQLII
jgi:putative serine/threonine protein kinase